MEGSLRAKATPGVVVVERAICRCVWGALLQRSLVLPPPCSPCNRYAVVFFHFHEYSSSFNS